MRRRILSLLLIVGQLWPSLVVAVSNQSILPGTPVIFADSAQTPTRAWTLSALAASAGRVSVQHDQGAGAHAAYWSFVCKIQLTGTLVIPSQVEFYVAVGDGTNVAGEVGTADAALASSDKRRNLRPLGVLAVDQTTQNVTMTAIFDGVYLPQRYFSLVIWNATGIALTTSTSVHRCVGTPYQFQMS